MSSAIMITDLAAWHLLGGEEVIHEGGPGAGQLVVTGVAAAGVRRVVCRTPWAPGGATLRGVGGAAFLHPTRGLPLIVGT